MPLPLLQPDEQLPFPQPTKITATTRGYKNNDAAPAALASQHDSRLSFKPMEIGLHKARHMPLLAQLLFYLGTAIFMPAEFLFELSHRLQPLVKVWDSGGKAQVGWSYHLHLVQSSIAALTFKDLHQFLLTENLSLAIEFYFMGLWNKTADWLVKLCLWLYLSSLHRPVSICQFIYSQFII